MLTDPQDGISIICVILRNIDAESIDYDTLIYCYLKVRISAALPVILSPPLPSLPCQPALGGPTVLRLAGPTDC